MCRVSQKWPFPNWFVIMVKIGSTHYIWLVCPLNSLTVLPLSFFPWRNDLIGKESEVLGSGPREICSLFNFSQSVRRIISSHSVYNLAQADGWGRGRQWVRTQENEWQPPSHQWTIEKILKGQRKAKHCRVRPESRKIKVVLHAVLVWPREWREMCEPS